MDLAGLMAWAGCKTPRDSFPLLVEKSIALWPVSVRLTKRGADRQAQLSWHLPVQIQEIAKRLPEPSQPRPAPRPLLLGCSIMSSKVGLSHQPGARETIHLLKGAEIEVSQDTEVAN